MTEEQQDPQNQQAPQTEEETQVEKLQKELADMTEHAKRAMADMQNLKRRHEEERRLIISMANIDLMRSMLPVIDNLDRAKEHAPTHNEESAKWFEGIEMSLNQLKKICQDFGLQEIEALGQVFNPELHEALVHGPGEKDQVIEVLEKGYKLGDRVIRHSKVKVGNGMS